MSALAAASTALWLGLLTAISPCPLATNLAALSYVGRQAGTPGRALRASLAYTLGRAAAYALVAGLLALGAASVPTLADGLSYWLNRVMGPLLVLVGMSLLGLLPLGFSSNAGSQPLRERAARSGLIGAALLGALFALSFCPVSAALFFGSLVPLTLQQGSPVLLPGLFGLGTAAPVLVLAVLLAAGGALLGRTLARLTALERWARRITGLVFVGVGIYYSFEFIFLA